MRTGVTSGDPKVEPAGNEASFHPPANGRKVLIALSGGVDSAVSALRLRDAGFDVSAAYIRTWMNEDELGDCPAREDIRDCEAVCRHLGIDFEVVNLVGDYRERVVRYLVEGYRRGITPNPDVMCNREMKFGVFLDYAREAGFGAVATGHHCRKRGGPGEPELWEGADAGKDQSYFLALMTPEQLVAARFPIGDLTKAKVRDMAREAGLPVHGKKDSQGICFLGKVNIQSFLSEYIPDAPGPIETTDGRVIGEHSGLHHFTIGQRKGIGVPSNTDNEFFVVAGKDHDRNALVVAFDSDQTSPLYTDEAIVDRFSWLCPPPAEETLSLDVRVRYRDDRTPVAMTFRGDGSAHLRFAEIQRGLASGQILAVYDGGRLIGGAVFR